MGPGESWVTWDGGGIFSLMGFGIGGVLVLVFLFYAQALLGGLYLAGVVFACLSWWGWGLGFCVRFSSFTRQTLMIINEKKKP